MSQAAIFTQWAEAVQRARPSIAFILGSGLGSVANRLVQPQSISFREIPELTPTSVDGHRGFLTLGAWLNRPVLIFEGRLHCYEGHSWRKVVLPVVTAKYLGISLLIFTNAAGGIHESLIPGSFMAIRDHIEWTRPYCWRLSGPGGLGASRPSPYSARLLGIVKQAARGLSLEVHEGTYGAVTGPCYETAAEIRALRGMGADAVGMSTAREVQTGFDAGLECLGISCITNRAAGLNQAPINHGGVLAAATFQSKRLADLLESCLPEF
jgi:purine-nucleoside phosphorylase